MVAWLDDRAWCHPKLVNLSDRAHRVYINSLAYASGMATKGRLTQAQQRLLGATPAIRRELLDARCWDDLGDDIAIHDWTDHNARRDARREADRERKRAARLKERPQDSPADSPKESPRERRQDRRALKEVKEVTERSTDVDLSDERPRDELWDALVAELGEPATKNERGRRNAAVKQLREIATTSEEVRRRCRAYRRMWPDITLTDTALVSNWTTLKQADKRRSVEEIVNLPDISDDERRKNLERAGALAESIGKPT